jgi:hypothetical protein
MRTKSPKKDSAPQREPEGSRVGGFIVGAFIGLLLGWGAGQFVRFDTGWDLLIHLGVFGMVFGALGAILPEKTFLKVLSWFH